MFPNGHNANTRGHGRSCLRQTAVGSGIRHSTDKNTARLCLQRRAFFQQQVRQGSDAMICTSASPSSELTLLLCDVRGLAILAARKHRLAQ